MPIPSEQHQGLATQQQLSIPSEQQQGLISNQLPIPSKQHQGLATTTANAELNSTKD